uniref:NADH dehydrogenase [ubiquinone] 1 beta subcomplex subunit 8, mitochondrial n=1 Tax=Cacopsylla melanoneura TaxID=428564 RepID=A0A8D8TRN1_9HEMI
MFKLRVLSHMKAFKAFPLVSNVSPLQVQAVRTAYVYTPDWLPGKRPQTEEEHKKAAKRYNMLPEEYEPQPDDGLATGDYPHLPTSHLDDRDPFYPWDYPLLRTNYGEALPDDFIINTYGIFNPNEMIYKKLPWGEQIIKATLLFSGFAFMIWFFMLEYRYYDPKFNSPLYKKGTVHYGYPDKGVVHYGLNGLPEK